MPETDHILVITANFTTYFDTKITMNIAQIKSWVQTWGAKFASVYVRSQYRSSFVNLCLARLSESQAHIATFTASGIPGTHASLLYTLTFLPPFDQDSLVIQNRRKDWVVTNYLTYQAELNTYSENGSPLPTALSVPDSGISITVVNGGEQILRLPIYPSSYDVFLDGRLVSKQHIVLSGKNIRVLASAGAVIGSKIDVRYLLPSNTVPGTRSNSYFPSGW